MSVIGFDFGNESCFVAVAKAGGIETVDNDYSLRATPSCVAFGERKRIIGVAAKNQAITNLKNTIFGFKHLLGRTFDDPIVQDGFSRTPFKITRTENGGIGIVVSYLGEEKVFTPVQITAMLLTKLKETAEEGINAKVHDCVISVPSYFTDAERRALMDAAHIAGLHVLRLLNETAAAALNYGIYKQDLPDPEDKPRNVVIVDCGHSAIQVSIVAFNKMKLKILATTADPRIGGRNFDTVLAAHFCEEFRNKYGVDAEKNQRAYTRLITEVEKLKKQMSANTTKLPLNIECFMEEKDVTSTMCRADFENMCASLFQRVELVFQKCLKDSQLTVNEIHSVEIIGGSTRIPAIKSLIEKVFGKLPSTTLNQDEAVSRGCALQCAILSPAFKVRDFVIGDVQPYPIKLVWDESIGEDGESEIFPQYHPIPFSRMVTFVRKESMCLKAVYNGEVPYPTKEIANFTINLVNNEPEPCKLKVKAKINMNGIFALSSATAYDKVEVNESSETTTATNKETNASANASQESKSSNTEQAEPMDTSNPQKAAGDGAPEEANTATENLDGSGKPDTKKVVYKPRDVPIASMTFGLSREELDEKLMAEIHMISRDRNEKERLDSRNALEEYVYDLREKLDTDLNIFVEEGDRRRLNETLAQLETWLYEEGDDEKKEVYLQKLTELKNQGEPIKERRLEYEERPRAIKEFEIAQQIARKVVDLYNDKDAKYDHISPNEADKLVAAIKESEAWLDSCRQKFGQNYQPYMPSPVRHQEITEQRHILEKKVSAFTNIPKPKVEPPKDEEMKSKDAKNVNTDAEQKTAAGNSQPMDLD